LLDFTKKIKSKQEVFIFLVVYRIDKLVDDVLMTREEIRRENARRLAEKIGGKADFARALTMDPSQVSQLIGPTPTKNIGNSIARRIEQAFEKSPGYLDTLHADEEANFQTHDDRRDSSAPGAMIVTVGRPESDVIPIKKVALSLQAGVMGFEVSQEADDDTTIDLPRKFIEENDLVPQCLLAIKIRGDSMYPLMIDGDIVVINIADTRPKSGELYAVNFDGEAVVKQMIYEGREWYLVSFNKDKQYHRRICRGSECIVVGRVVRQEARKLIGRI
jgi:phage repressor protein C with HTH and peptisase S24 domain